MPVSILLTQTLISRIRLKLYIFDKVAHEPARHILDGVTIMAKPTTLQIKLVSTADTGYYYVTKKNPRTKPEKLELMKYDPKARKHVLFKESKIK